MFHPDPWRHDFCAYPIGPVGGCSHAWEFHLTAECPAWTVERRRLATADRFTGTLAGALDQYCALVAQRGGSQLHFVVCRCLVAPVRADAVPDIHGTVTVHLNL